MARILDPCYQYLDYFLPSIEQAAKVSGLQTPEEIAGFFLSRGVKNVVVKKRALGILLSKRPHSILCRDLPWDPCCRNDWWQEMLFALDF